MADTKHTHPAPPPVEVDEINYRGIVWFVVILTGTTLVCQVLMWVMFIGLDKRETGIAASSPRAPLAAPPGRLPSPPNLLYIDSQDPKAMQLGEPDSLGRFRRDEEHKLANYDWMDKNTGAVRIPIERAKDLLLERGLPARGATTAPATGKPAPTKDKH